MTSLDEFLDRKAREDRENGLFFNGILKEVTLNQSILPKDEVTTHESMHRGVAQRSGAAPTTGWHGVHVDFAGAGLDTQTDLTSRWPTWVSDSKILPKPSKFFDNPRKEIAMKIPLEKDPETPRHINPLIDYETRRSYLEGLELIRELTPSEFHRRMTRGDLGARAERLPLTARVADVPRNYYDPKVILSLRDIALTQRSPFDAFLYTSSQVDGVKVAAQKILTDMGYVDAEARAVAEEVRTGGYRSAYDAAANRFDRLAANAMADSISSWTQFFTRLALSSNAIPLKPTDYKDAIKTQVDRVDLCSAQVREILGTHKVRASYADAVAKRAGEMLQAK